MGARRWKRESKNLCQAFKQGKRRPSQLWASPSGALLDLAPIPDDGRATMEDSFTEKKSYNIFFVTLHTHYAPIGPGWVQLSRNFPTGERKTSPCSEPMANLQVIQVPTDRESASSDGGQKANHRVSKSVSS